MTTHDVDGVRALTARRRADLLDRLVQVFLVQGFAALSLGDLALRCHCSPGTLRVISADPEQLRSTVIAHYFAGAADAIERRTAAVTDPRRRPGEYLAAVADALRPASNAFLRDLERFPAGRAAYERTTSRAAERVRELLRDAVSAGRLRDVQASFVGDTVSVVTTRIATGAVLVSTGLDDARAYAELAVLVTEGLSS